MVKIKFLKKHNGYAPGDELECDAGVADAIVNWARAAVVVGPAAKEEPVRQDKMVKPIGGKQKVRTK